MDIKKIIPSIVGISALLIASCSPTNTNSSTIGQKKHPIAKPLLNSAGKPIKDQYISPFFPHNPIIAEGFKSGQLAGDPSTIKKNTKTGKPDLSTLKVFKLP